jgi:hypothetical protein
VAVAAARVLAARHGVRVRLSSQPSAGTAALVHLPDPLLEPLAPASRADVPRTDVPRADVPRADVPRADVPRADVPLAAGVAGGPARAALSFVPALIYEELASVWFHATPAGQSWRSPGDSEREQVASVLAQDSYDETAVGLPRRRAGSRLMPGSVPATGERPARIDPERVRTRLAGLGRAVLAAERESSRS